MTLTKEQILKVKERKEKGESLRSIAQELGVSHQALSKRLRNLEKKVTKVAAPIPSITEKIEGLEERQKVKVAKESCQKATMFDLHLKVMKYLNENDNELTQLALRNLPKGWGGSLRRGGGWSGHWLCLLEILEQIGVYVKA